MPTIKQNELLQLLIDEQVLAPEKIKEFINESEVSWKRIDDVLVKQEILDIEKLAEYKARVYGFPYKKLIDKDFKKDILNIIPKEVANNYKIICFDRNREVIMVGITDPDNFKAIEAVDFLAKGKKYRVDYYVISEPSFQYAFAKYDDVDKELGVALLP